MRLILYTLSARGALPLYSGARRAPARRLVVSASVSAPSALRLVDPRDAADAEAAPLPEAASRATIVGVDAAVRRILVVGDGDLSFSAALASVLVADAAARPAGRGPPAPWLVATTLEDEPALRARYGEDAGAALAALRAAPRSASVVLGVDATALHEPATRARLLRAAAPSGATDAGASFERVVWNYPHHMGKTNTRRNRELVGGFLRALTDDARAPPLLAADGEVLVALCEGQGGTECSDAATGAGAAATPPPWNQTWQLPVLAAEAGLVIGRVAPFSPDASPGVRTLEAAGYRARGHRGGARDARAPRGFARGAARLHHLVYAGAGGTRAMYAPGYEHEIQVWCARGAPRPSADAFGALARRAAGARDAALVARVEEVDEYEHGGVLSVGFRVTFASARVALTRDAADAARERVEDALPALLAAEMPGVSLRHGKCGFRVGRARPWSLELGAAMAEAECKAERLADDG